MPAIALTIAIALAIAGIAMAIWIDRLNGRQKTDEVTVQADILAATVTAAMVFNDRAAAREYVNAMRANPEIEAVVLYDALGRVFVSDTRLPGGSVPASLLSNDLHFEGDRLIVAVPVEQNGLRIGTVYMQVAAEPLSRRIQRYGVIALLVTMASLVVAVLAVHQSELGRTNAALESANRDLLAQIDQREKAEDALRQAQKMEAIGQLTGGVAHDFNNLLQIILGNLDRLRRRHKPGDDSEQAKAQFLQMTDAAIEGAQRAAQLTQRMLAFSRRQPLAPKPIDVNRLVLGMSDMLGRTLGESISLETVLAGGLWRALADENQLENAILNLAVNARDAMPASGKLTIEAANVALDEAYAAAERNEVTPGQYVMIAVSDTGSGIPREVLAKVFEPFFTTKSIGQGTGLGLSQVYGFVKQSGGHVKIYSEPGEGTTVKLYLPRVQMADDRAEKPAAEPRVTGGDRSETILVVEDEEGVRRLAVETLRDLGYRVLEAEDGRAALRVLKRDPGVRLLFTDVGLPGGLNGRQLVDIARQDRPELKVLFTTGYARNAIVHHGRLDPHVELIAKPFQAASLAQKVRELLDASQQAQG
jgi:signal transduction histidine kinase/ActR/RegA family two-component response regulator